MAQYAVLIYADDSAHALDATAEDIAECDEHADELVADNSMVMAYALTPARARHIDPRRTGSPTVRSSTPRRSWPASTSSRPTTSMQRWPSPAPTQRCARGGGVEVRPVHSGGLVERPAV